MIPRHDITGLVLAGGRSSRMQRGSGNDIDKGLLLLNGMPLVEHAVRHLQPYVDSVLISANRHLDDYARYGRVISDSPCFGEYAGPLAGIATALQLIATPWMFVLPTDVAGLPDDLVSRLSHVAYNSDSRLIYAKFGSHDQPLCAMMRTSLRQPVRDFLEQGGRRVHEWMANHNAQIVSFQEPTSGVVNINTPEDLWRAHPTMPNSAPGGG